MDRASKPQAPHRRAVSEPVNDYYRHKHLPRLPHEIDTYRTRSLPDLPPGASNLNSDQPPSKNAFEIPPSTDKPLPLAPLQTGEAVKRRRSTVEVDAGVGTESFFPYWSKILLLKWESVGGWEEKLRFAREMQDCWTEGGRFAHEVRKCAMNCACGMV